MAQRVEEVYDTLESVMRSQAEIGKYISAYITSMVLKCAVELRIADIIHSHGGPITLFQIASGITDSPSLNVSFLERIMRLLVHRKIFTTRHSSEGGDDQTLYGLTNLSRLILWDSKPSLAKHVMLINHPLMMAPWQYLSQSVIDGELPLKKAHGCGQLWEYALENPEIQKLLAGSEEFTVDTMLAAFLEAYKDELDHIGSLVDVGGRSGRDLYEIVKSHPHIKAINFDLPDVIATVDVLEGVSHVGGDMFEAIPTADALFMKGILRAMTDEEAVTVLKNCRKAIPEKTGKVIIQDIVTELGNHKIFEENHILSDLAMLTFSNGRERTEVEWKKLLNEGGFPRYKVIKLLSITSIIEAYPL